MKYYLLLITGLFLMKITTAQTEVMLGINHLLGEEKLQSNAEGENDMGHSFNVMRLEYYISDIRIIHDGGQETIAEDVYLLVNGLGDSKYNLGSYDVNSIDSIIFSIGVDAKVNHEDPSQWPSTHALSPKNPSMHWGWAAGYRFAAIEGYAGEDKLTRYEVHALGNKNYFRTRIAVNSVMEDDKIIIALDADYTKALSTVDLEKGPITHGDFDEAITVLQNFNSSVFTIAEGGLASVFSQEDNYNLSVFPNPTLNQSVTIQVEDISGTFEVEVYNGLGQLESTITIEEMSSKTISFQEKGCYFLHIRRENALIETMKILCM